MRDHELSRHRLNAAKSKNLDGAQTAEEKKGELRIDTKNLWCVASISLVIVAFGLASLQPAFASDSKKRIVPVQTSTIPANGDLNPYGVAFVPDGFPKGGPLAAGDIVVSNFNDKTNTQGTGTTIVSITPDGKQSVFFQGTPPLGLTTALGVLKKGFVIVGNVPNIGGIAQTGSLIILDKTGTQVSGSPIVDPTFLDGPWDLDIVDNGNSAIVFVSCVLNGTVTRLELTFSDGSVAVKSKVTIADGYGFGPNATAFVVGPTGLAFDPQTDVLYVASTKDNEIFAVSDADKATTSKGTGKVVFSDSTHLHGPLALVLAPNGNLISSQGDAINPSPDPAEQSEIVEFTKKGKFVGQFSIDSAVGAAFGIAIERGKGAIDFAAVDDQIDVLTVYAFTEK